MPTLSPSKCGAEFSVSARVADVGFAFAHGRRVRIGEPVDPRNSVFTRRTQAGSQTARPPTAGRSGSQLQVHDGNGDATFEDPTRFRLGRWSGVPVFVDLNADGLRDLVLPNRATRDLTVLFNQLAD